MHEPFIRFEKTKHLARNFDEQHPNPNQLRWAPFDLPIGSVKIDFVEGLHTVCGAGDPRSRHGVAVHVYLCNASMVNRAFYNSDGDFLIGG